MQTNERDTSQHFLLSTYYPIFAMHTVHSHGGEGNFNMLVEIRLFAMITTTLIIISDNSSSNPPGGTEITRILVSLLRLSFSSEIK